MPSSAPVSARSTRLVHVELLELAEQALDLGRHQGKAGIEFGGLIFLVGAFKRLDGTIEKFVAPQAVAIAPGHDGWVVGSEPAVLIEFDFEGETVARMGLKRD